MHVGKKKSFLFLLPFLICFILFWVAPFIYGIYMSFHDWSLARGAGEFVGMENYLTILRSGNMYNKLFSTGLKNTLLFVLISVPCLVIISLGLALLVDNLPKKKQPIFRTIFFISYSISVTAVASIFLWLFNENGGFINNILINLNIIGKPINWLTQQPYAWIVILITTIWWTIGFNMILFINALNDIDESIYEASYIDGANFIDRLIYIIIPSIKNVLFYIILTTITASFNLYGQSQLITGGGPAQSTNTLIMNIQQVVLAMNDLGVGSAMAIIMGIIMIIVFIIQRRVMKEG